MDIHFFKKQIIKIQSMIRINEYKKNIMTPKSTLFNSKNHKDSLNNLFIIIVLSLLNKTVVVRLN